MQLTLSIRDDQVESIDKYLQTQVVSSYDELTGRPVMTPRYEDAEDFLLKMVAQAVYEIVSQYPTTEMRVKLQEIKALEDQIKFSTRPTKLDASAIGMRK